MKYYILLPLMAVSALSAGESWYDKEDIAVGKSLFDKNCVVCHGANASGTVANWRDKMSNGKMPPPPLNGTAHTWHHKPELIDKIIQEGGETYGKSYKGWMPASNPDYTLELQNFTQIIALWVFTKNHRLTFGLTSSFLQISTAQAFGKLKAILIHNLVLKIN